MKKFLTAFLVPLILVTACPFKRYPVSEAAKVASRRSGVVISREVTQATPCGAVHFGKFPLSELQLQFICDGIEERQDAAIADGFKATSRKPGSFYEIYTPPFACVPSPIQRIPSFMVNGGNYYDGTDYDQYNSKGPAKRPYRQHPANGFDIVHVQDGQAAVFAAEFIISIGTPGSTYQKGMMYACPDVSVLKEAVGNGVDHIYYANFPFTEEFRDRPPYDVWVWFNATIYHGPGHPLIPRYDPLAAFSMVDAKKGPASSIVTAGAVPENNLGLPTDGLSVLSSSAAIVRAVK